MLSFLNSSDKVRLVKTVVLKLGCFLYQLLFLSLLCNSTNFPHLSVITSLASGVLLHI